MDAKASAAVKSSPVRNVLVIGSGPIVIGQAAEFDYAGVQACRALREEGHRVVLVNSNPATIMTDTEVADAVYLEPLTVASIEAIIERERLDASLIHQALVETSLLGWKEIEYEILRDAADNCIVVCNMENFDPVGVHTGDSIVVAPSQTLSDVEYQRLRSASLNVIRALKVQGGCNIQFALHPERTEYRIIEVNPRVSRSSGLASKATGYPIAKISTRIALGQTLDEI